MQITLQNESGICEYENSNLIIKAKKNEIAMMHISIKASTNALKTHCLSLPMYASGFSGPSYFVLSFRLFVSFSCQVYYSYRIFSFCPTLQKAASISLCKSTSHKLRLNLRFIIPYTHYYSSYYFIKYTTFSDF